MTPPDLTDAARRADDLEAVLWHLRRRGWEGRPAYQRRMDQLSAMRVQIAEARGYRPTCVCCIHDRPPSELLYELPEGWYCKDHQACMDRLRASMQDMETELPEFLDSEIPF